MDSALKNILIAQRPGSAVADLGLKKLKPYLEKDQNTQEARATGDFFLKAIEAHGSDDEKSIASTALKATASPDVSHGHALCLQETVLSAIAAGITGPAAVAIADAGTKYFSRDFFFSGQKDEELSKYTISNALASGISQYGTEDQKAAADKIKELDDTYWDVHSAMNISLLSDIAVGTPYSFAQYIARAGSSGFSELNSSYLKEGGSFIGPIIDTISAQGTDGEKALASLGQGISLKGTEPESYCHFQKALMASIGAGGAHLASMISLYNDMVDEKTGVAYYQREFYGSRVLDAIASQAPKNIAPVASAIARSARATGGMIAAEILRSQAGKLNPQMPGSLEKNLTDFEKEVSEVTAWKASCHCGLSANKKSFLSSVKGVFLGELREHTDDKAIAAIADEALKSTTPQSRWQKMFTSFPSETTLKTRAQALNRIISKLKVTSLEEEMMPELGKILSQERRNAAIQEGSAESKVEQFDDFVEIDGLKIHKNEMAHLLRS
jgi:hypothetical protein